MPFLRVVQIAFSLEKPTMSLPKSKTNLVDADQQLQHIIFLKKSYNKKVPPITTIRSPNLTGVRVPVNVSMILMKVVQLTEVMHTIKLQFEINLEWK